MNFARRVVVAVVEEAVIKRDSGVSVGLLGTLRTFPASVKRKKAGASIVSVSHHTDLGGGK